jgi:glycosyltransferase involved in cell wall biosynthesis
MRYHASHPYQPMKLVYLADTQIPSRATNGMQIVRMCAAFASCGVDVTLVHPHRFGNEPEGLDDDLWSFYGVRKSFRVVTLPSPLTQSLSQRRLFARAARGLPLSAFVVWRSRPGAAPFAFYCRSLLGVWLAIRARLLWGSRSSCRGILLELHDAPSTEQAWDLVRRVNGVVTNSDALREHVSGRVNGLMSSMITARNGFDPQQFRALSEAARRATRARLALDDATTVVGYTGRVNVEKGVPTILEAAAFLQGRPIRFLLVGKVYDHIATRAAELPSVMLTGFVPPSEVSAWLAAMDILVMPTSARISYAAFTCPLKLFEYMASGRPVLCSDLPVLREVVTDEKNALLFRADDAHSLASGIERLRTDAQLADSLARAAASDVARYTWEKRATRILDFIRSSTALAETT